MLNSRDLVEYRRLPRNMIRGLVQNYQRLESYGSPSSTVTSAMQEDCLRIGEKELLQESRNVRRTVLGVDGKSSSTKIQATGFLLAVKEIIITIEVVLKLEVLGTQNLSFRRIMCHKQSGQPRISDETRNPNLNQERPEL